MHTQKGRTDAARGSSPFGAGSFASLSIYISHLGGAALPQDCPDHCVVILSLESDGGWCASVSQRSCAPYTLFTYGACSQASAVFGPQLAKRFMARTRPQPWERSNPIPAKAPPKPHRRSASPARPTLPSKSPKNTADRLAGKNVPWPTSLRLFLYLFPSSNYGVVILAASAAGTVAGAAGHSFILGCFTDALVTDVGLARSTVAACFTLAILVSALYANVIGAAVDRMGPRLLISAAALPYAAAIASMALVSDAQSLQLSMLAIRMLGPETIDFASRAAVTQWWVARRGVATGVLNLVGASTSTLPALIAMAIEAGGWRRTLRWMAALMGSAALCVSALLLHKPEDYGLRPDTGRRPPPPSPSPLPNATQWRTAMARPPCVTPKPA